VLCGARSFIHKFPEFPDSHWEAAARVSQVWDLSAPGAMNPLRSLEEHSHEVYSVEWNPSRRDCFLSASWDDTIKLWNLDAPSSLRTFAEHTYCIYTVSWNPAHAGEPHGTASVQGGVSSAT
jgi:WD40 repeat protein